MQYYSVSHIGFCTTHCSEPDVPKSTSKSNIQLKKKKKIDYDSPLDFYEIYIASILLPFSIMPNSCHYFLALHTFVNSSFQS